jgi:hypothetical protein
VNCICVLKNPAWLILRFLIMVPMLRSVSRVINQIYAYLLLFPGAMRASPEESFFQASQELYVYPWL